jgi:hypothetical protein
MGRQIAIVFVVLLFVAAAIDLVIKPAGSPTARATPSATTSVSATGTPKPTPTPSTTPRPTYVPTPPPPPVRVSGSGTGNSYVFRLNDSQGYVVSYSLPSGCQYFGELRSTDGTYDNTDFISDTGPTSGNKQLTYPLSGTYYVAMTAHYACQWSLVFWPR